MGSETSIMDRIKDSFSIRLERNTMIVILVNVIGYLIWFFALPLFGPVLSSYFSDMRVLAIEKGRVLQVFFLFMTLSSIVSGYLIDKTGKRTIFIFSSTLLGASLTIILAFFSNIIMVFLITAILGITAGISPVAWGTFFADYTAPEDRGRLMGLCVAISIPISYIFMITGSINIGGFQNIGIIIIAVLLLISLSSILLKPKDVEISERDARRSRGAGTRQIILYSVPVFLFYTVVGVLYSTVFPTIQNNIDNSLFFLTWAIPILFGALYGGIMLDMRGRKFPMILGLALTGVSLAFIGVLGIRRGSLAIATLAIGYSIVTISSFIIWSDLASMKGRGTQHGLGFGLIAIALLIGLIVSGGGFGSISESRLRNFMFFSAVSLFLCIPPLIIAEDALPKEIIEKRQMEEHLRRAREKMMNQ